MQNMDIKQKKKTIIHQLRIAEERIESASIILERKVKVDAIPILYEAVDIIVRILISSRQKPLDNFQKNIKVMEEEYNEERLWEKGALELFHSLDKMNEKYKSEMELEFDTSDINNVFDKAENFLFRTRKFQKSQLMSLKEKMIRARLRKILAIGGVSIGALIIIFFLIKFGINKLFPAHGLLAQYYDNIDFEEPAAVEKIDENIDFVWADMSPHETISGYFSIRWQGRIRISKDDNYIFTLATDEGAKLLLDDKMLIDTWTLENRALEHSENVDLEKGFHSIMIKYYFNQSYSDIKLLWSSSFFNKKIVEKKSFYPPKR